MVSKTIDRWELAAIAVLILSAAYVGILVLLLHFAPETFGTWAAFVETLPFNPNHLLPPECKPPRQPMPGYRIVRQVNVLLIPLTAFYLTYHARRDFTNEERVSGLDLFLGAASLPMLPLLVFVATCPEASTMVAESESNILRLLYGVAMDYGAGGFIYLLGCLIFSNGITYLPAFALSRLARRLKGTWEDAIDLGTLPDGGAARAIRESETLNDLVQNPRARHVLARVWETPASDESADEFIAGLPPRVQVVAHVVQAHGTKSLEQSGVRSATSDATAIRGPYGYVALALLCGIARQRFVISGAADERDKKHCSFEADIPASYLSWKGALAVQVQADRQDNAITATVVFPGQRFAWGRGRSIVRRLFRDSERYVRAFERRRL